MIICTAGEDDYAQGEWAVESLWESQEDLEEVQTAIRAAVATAVRLQEDVAIMDDLAIIPLSRATEVPLEVIRIDGASFPVTFSQQTH
tara:strand:- start:307 stop:570 length:264 start_codon:yes stop_codon:yes gene_type:complete